MLFLNHKHPIEIKIAHLNKRKHHNQQMLMMEMGDKKGLKKSLKKTLKEKAGLAKNKASKKQIFVLDFQGDVKASQVQSLREEISTLMMVAKSGDEVIVRLESAGGLVHGYGLAAAQLTRLKAMGLTVTVCVDKVAASGGYMMACVADKIIASPFAVLGSIGVVAQVPNFHKLLENHDIDVNLFTAGKYKRTVTVFAKNDEEDKQKFQQELEQTHVLFQDFVNQYRPQLDLEKVSTGEHWYGLDALNLKLVDELKTSDSYILECMEQHEVYALYTRQKPTLAEKLGLASSVHSLIEAGMDKLPEILHQLEHTKVLLKK